LRDALRESPTAEFSAITAADVFIYVGDIEEIVRDARRVLMKDGMFVFSCEATKAGEPDLILRDTMRYAHSASAVRAMCEAAGFKQVDIESFDLRNEGGAPVAGYIVHAYT
jgi:predicted TPR repeat methyltransferase